MSVRTGAAGARVHDEAARFDVVIVGAGFAGLYLLYRLRGMGLSARAYELGDAVGGTWYWNRYPGARCDAESLAYSFSFSPELEQEWEWTERYATQPEILRYAEHVADRFDLRRDIRFARKVTAARFDPATAEWLVETEQGDRARARFCIMATGCLSVPQRPDLAGIDDFTGNLYQASRWPHQPVGFAGQRVGVIGTGSSAIQAIPVIAGAAGHLCVFQRTPNFSVPACNAPLDPQWVAAFKQHYREHRALHRIGAGSGFGDLEIEPRARAPAAASAADLSDADVCAILDNYWNHGGARFIGAIGDTLTSRETNRLVADFVRAKIRATVQDPATAEALCPSDHPIGTRRICVDTGYYETYNRPNVTLVDVARDPIERITPAGVQTRYRHYELDTLVLATGFDAMTGALLRIDIRGEGGVALRDRWAGGPRSYLGLMVAGFPNLFTVTGPGSPSVLSNMLVSIEQHVDWIMDCLRYLQDHGWQRIEALPEAESAWIDHVNGVANATLFGEGGSWYLGANVPGKPRMFMPYAGGVGPYRAICDRVAGNGYEGFRCSRITQGQ
jgi:cation diffusion facilitator CzcD-associated flavoprotein CzcO